MVSLPVTRWNSHEARTGAIDGGFYRTLAGFADWDIAPAWGVPLEAGSVDSYAGRLNRYLSAALRYRW